MDQTNKTIRLGLVCINNELRKKEIFCSRTLISKNYSLEKAMDRASQNLLDLQTIIQWNVDHGIFHYRLSSEMFPRITDPDIPISQRLKIHDFKNILYSIGCFINEKNVRVTMHPGQYNQVGAENSSVFEKTVEDLSTHADILDSLGMDNNSILTVHGGGVYGDKEKTCRRWIEQFDDLPRNVKNRLTIENCERQYNIEDVLHIAEETKIPVIFDSHHFNCYNEIYEKDFDPFDYIEPVIDTWGERRMVVHISEQKENARIGSHSDFINVIPDYFLHIPKNFNIGLDIEVEAKAKEAAIFKLKEKYHL